MNEKALWEQLKNDNKSSSSVCPDINELAAYIDGNLSDSEHESMEQHLNACPECLDMVLALNEMPNYEKDLNLQTISKAQALFEGKASPGSIYDRFPSSWLVASALFIFFSFGGFFAGQNTFESSQNALELLWDEDLQPLASSLDDSDTFEYFNFGELQ